MNFTFLEVTNSELLEKVFAFRYKIITESEIFDGYVRETEFPNNKESDKFDPFSIHFVALNENAKVCATVRLIHHCPYKYPTEKMIFNTSKFKREKLGEISRIFIHPECRDLKTTKEIIDNFKKLLYAKLMDLDIEYTYGALKSNLIRLLKIFKMCYEELSEMQMLGSMGLRYPCILYTKRLGDDNPELVEAWKKKNA